MLVGRQHALLAAAAAAAREAGAEDVTTRAADLGDPDARARLLDTLATMDPPVQVLINNAGVAVSASLANTEDSIWARALEVNLTAPFALIRALVPKMTQAGWGRIVNVASTAGLKGYAYTAAYSATKAGLLGLTRSLAAELARTGITVNAVCPGFTDTDMASEAVRNIAEKTGRTEAQARGQLERFSPIGRLVRPDEVATMVAYLCSEAAAIVNGQAFAIDGGETVS
jgi:NAD(P)-dependent dehydrogenase (short-subunit alcohol dehydrogenase family)